MRRVCFDRAPQIVVGRSEIAKSQLSVSASQQRVAGARREPQASFANVQRVIKSLTAQLKLAECIERFERWCIAISGCPKCLRGQLELAQMHVTHTNLAHQIRIRTPREKRAFRLRKTFGVAVPLQENECADED